MSDFERIVEITPAYDKRDADSKKDYGIHGVDIRMVLKGPEGATQFALSTGWYLPETVGLSSNAWTWDSADAHNYGKALAGRPISSLHPMPTDLGYHSVRPMYEGQEPIGTECPYVSGGVCYYDGSGLNAYRIFGLLLREGSEGVWRALETYYVETFETEAVSA